jgi:omega-3 fatty acid desaturase (delta-15 desaturase)
MVRDLGLLAATFAVASVAYDRALALEVQPALRLCAAGGVLALNALVAGFLMWCAFVVGHDAGHGTFSNSAVLNAVAGHLCHAPLMVPYWPWAFSHNLHHRFHNHKSKDHSFPWFTENEWAAMGTFKRGVLSNYLAPFYMYPVYLLIEGFDGCHFWPWSHMYKQGSLVDRVKCAASTVAVFAAGIAIKAALGGWTRFGAIYAPAYFVFCFWLFTVTYLQHHEEGTKVYTDADWAFVKGGLETVDRTYGLGIDAFHHHISSCHVAHHLFFRAIPHYHLPKASAAVRGVLEPLGLYKNVDTPDFALRVCRYNNVMGGRMEKLAEGMPKAA